MLLRPPRRFGEVCRGQVRVEPSERVRGIEWNLVIVFEKEPDANVGRTVTSTSDADEG